jgi:hypothetical protein
MVNLFDIDSYYHYLKKFSDAEWPGPALKELMAVENPHEFLFGQRLHARQGMPRGATGR